MEDDKVATVSAFLQSSPAELNSGLSVSVQALLAVQIKLLVDVRGNDATLALRVR